MSAPDPSRPPVDQQGYSPYQAYGAQPGQAAPQPNQGYAADQAAPQAQGYAAYQPAAASPSGAYPSAAPSQPAAYQHDAASQPAGVRLPPGGSLPAPPGGRGPVQAEHFPGGIGLDGRLPWVLGLLAMLGLPMVSLLVPGIAMVIAGLLQGRKNPVAARTGRRAAIYGAIHVLIVLLYLGVLIVASAMTDGQGVTIESHPVLMYGFAFPFAIYIAGVGPLLTVALAIVALVRPVSRDKARRILADSGR